jgi:hypothetical protein
MYIVHGGYKNNIISAAKSSGILDLALSGDDILLLFLPHAQSLFRGRGEDKIV